MAADPASAAACTPAETEQRVEAAGASKVAASTGRTFVLAMLAGLDIGLGGTFMLLVKSDGTLSFAVAQVLGGLVFCLGLFLVLVAGAELFTGNCLMVEGLLSRRYTFSQLLRQWIVVYLGNFAGALLLVALLVGAGFFSMNSGAVGETAASVASTKAALTPFTAFMRGILCNILVCFAVWMGFAGKSVWDKLVAALLPVTAFVALGFEHSVANMFFLPLGLAAQALGYAGTCTLAGMALNLVFVTLGNIVGGVAVGAAYWFVYGRKD